MNPSPHKSARALALVATLFLVAAAPVTARNIDVEVWTDRGDDAVYQAGEAMRVKVRTSADAYLLVYEIDTDGDVNLLYPWKRGSGRVEARRTLRLPPDESDHQLVVEQETGQGFLVAVASEQPFRDLPWFLRPFDPQAASVGYEGAPEGQDVEEGFDEDGRIVGDPYVAMERIRRRVMSDPGDTERFATAYSTYYVHEQVRYPRYLCNDCHRPNRWAWWPGFDPYYAHCSVMDFRVNWSWYWGPHIWTTYVPYYYYVVRTDCPPRYRPWIGSRNRFSSWDGWDRFGNLWGGQLRRYKPAPAPVSYSPPPPRGMIWRQGSTPPGFVPKDVQRQTKEPGTRPQTWLKRDVGGGRAVWKEGARPLPDGRTVWKEGARPRPDGRPGAPVNVRPGRDPQPTREGGQKGASDRFRDWGRQGGERPQRGDRGGSDTPPRYEPSDRGDRGSRGERGQPEWRPPANDSPPRDVQRREPARQEPARQDPGYKQPPPPSPEPPRWSPPASKPDRPDPPRGKDKDRNGKG